MTVKDQAGNDIRQLTGRAEAGSINRIAWDMRSDAPIQPAAGQTQAAGGGRGGRGGGAVQRRPALRLSPRPRPAVAGPANREPRIPRPPPAAAVVADVDSAAIAATWSIPALIPSP